MSEERENDPRRIKLILIILSWQVILFILYGIFVTYEHSITPTSLEDIINTQNTGVDHFYPMLQDVHVMMFIGFGFLLTFLKRYGFNGVGLNFLIGALALQWGMFVLAFFVAVGKEGDDTTVDGIRYLRLNIQSIISGDFCVGSVLIAYGATMGKTNTLQLFTMMIMMIPLYGLNEYIGIGLLGAVDMGGSIFVHIFGAYFGLAYAFVVTNREAAKGHKGNGSSYSSDMFAMIGTLFLWMFWPSFNGALALGSQQHRVVINTILSLTGSCVFAYLASYLLRHDKAFCMVDVQNATLAGGVAVGSSSDLVIQPWGALLIGAIAGTLSVIGYTKIQPFLEKKLDYSTPLVFTIYTECLVSWEVLEVHSQLLPPVNKLMETLLEEFSTTDHQLMKLKQQH